MYKVAIIGSGLQANRRAPVVVNSKDSELIVVASDNIDSAKVVAKKYRCEYDLGWENTIRRDDIDVVLVCTPPNTHAEISIFAMNEGKHVLCEKPLCRTLNEAYKMLETSQRTGRILKCGFNHRHHHSILNAKMKFDSGEIGAPLFARCVYGICGRPGYEKEWRANPNIVSGGQLMEQGIHAIDLYRWFFGEFDEVLAFTATNYWPIDPLEDNAFVVLKKSSGIIASLHSSLTQWKNLFDFEIYGTEGYLRVEGLGGAYGVSRLIQLRKDYLAPFAETVIEYRGEDKSWLGEWNEFISSIRENRIPIGNAVDGIESLRLVLAAYESSTNAKAISPKDII